MTQGRSGRSLRPVVLVAVCAAACGRAGTAGSTAPGGDRALAVVDAEVIDEEALRWAVGSADLSPEAALSRLVDQTVLVAAAERRGLRHDPRVALIRRQAMVQRLLSDVVESEVRPDEVDEAMLRRRYASELERFVRQELRRSRHVLAELPDAADAAVDLAARRAVEALLARIADGETIEEVAGSPGPPPADGVRWRPEDVPPLGRGSDAEAAYLDALFSLEGPGIVPRAVRSGYGWHLIELVEIEPERAVSFEEAVPTLRAEETARRRSKRLDEALAGLRERGPVSVDASGLETFLSLPPAALGVGPEDGAP